MREAERYMEIVAFFFSILVDIVPVYYVDINHVVNVLYCQDFICMLILYFLFIRLSGFSTQFLLSIHCFWTWFTIVKFKSKCSEASTP